MGTEINSYPRELNLRFTSSQWDLISHNMTPLILYNNSRIQLDTDANSHPEVAAYPDSENINMPSE